MEYYYFTGFEDGQVGAGGSSFGISEYSSSKKKDGSYSFRVNPTGAFTGEIIVYDYSGSDGRQSVFLMDDLYVKFDFLYDIKPSSNYEYFQSFQGMGATKLYLALTSAGTIAVYDVTETLIDTGATVLNADTWYRIEAYCGTGVSGAWELRINGVTEISGTADLDILQHGYGSLGKIHDVNGESVDFYYDNFVAANFWVGDLYVNVHLPDADGTTHDWHSGTGTTYAEVDEGVVDGTTTELQNAGAGTNETHQVTFPANGETTSIRAVMAQAICRRLDASNRALKLETKVGGSTEVTIASNPYSTAYLGDGSSTWVKIWTDSFDTGLDWTESELDGIQVGVIEENAYADGCSQISYKTLMSRV